MRQASMGRMLLRPSQLPRREPSTSTDSTPDIGPRRRHEARASRLLYDLLCTLQCRHEPRPGIVGPTLAQALHDRVLSACVPRLHIEGRLVQGQVPRGQERAGAPYVAS